MSDNSPQWDSRTHIFFPEVLQFLRPALSPDTHQDGLCSHQDHEEGGPGHRREVLQPPGQRLPLQQARVQEDHHHSQPDTR